MVGYLSYFVRFSWCRLRRREEEKRGDAPRTPTGEPQALLYLPKLTKQCLADNQIDNLVGASPTTTFSGIRCGCHELCKHEKCGNGVAQHATPFQPLCFHCQNVQYRTIFITSFISPRVRQDVEVGVRILPSPVILVLYYTGKETRKNYYFQSLKRPCSTNQRIKRW